MTFESPSYVYRIDEPATGKFYIGRRTKHPDKDTNYFGSGYWPRSAISSGANLTKTIIAFFPSRLEANDLERRLIIEQRRNSLCTNVQFKRPAARAYDLKEKRSIFVDRLRTLRELSGLTQYQLAGKCGLDSCVISNFENARQTPKFHALRYLRVDLPPLTLRFWFALRRFPKGIKNGVNMFAGIHDLPRRDVAERSCAVWRLPVTADIISACSAFPERDMRQVWTVWINFLATCQPCVHFRGASAAVNGTYG